MDQRSAVRLFRSSPRVSVRHVEEPVTTGQDQSGVPMMGTDTRGFAGGSDLTVGFLVSSISRSAGGLQTSVRRLAQQCEANGSRVFVYGPADSYSDVDLSQWEPLRPKVFASFGPDILRFAPKIEAALRQDELEILQLHGLWQFPSIQALQWRKRHQRPLIVSPHGMLDSWALRNSSWKKRIARALFEDRNLRGAACIRALCESEADSIRALGLKTPIAIIPNGIDLPPEVELRQGNPSERKTLLYLGRLHPKKGLLETVAAWGIFKQKAPTLASQWRLVIAGWGNSAYENEVRAAVAEQRLAEDVELVGPTFGVQKDELLAAASAFVLASYSEGLPMAVLEAWAHGKPVLMTRACNLPEGFQSGAAKEISTDPEGIAVALSTYLRSDALVGCGEAGRKLVEDKFTWHTIGHQLDQLHKWLVHRAPMPDFIV